MVIAPFKCIFSGVKFIKSSLTEFIQITTKMIFIFTVFEIKQNLTYMYISIESRLKLSVNELK